METFWKKGGSNIAETISSILIFFSVSVGGIPFKWDIISQIQWYLHLILQKTYHFISQNIIVRILSLTAGVFFINISVFI